eukprot:12670862-Ditylum_brightwellii.AAC.1
MSDNNQDSNTVVLETPLPSGDDLWGEDTDDDSVWDNETVILDDVLVAMAEELENHAEIYIHNVIMNIFLLQNKQVTFVSWAA